MEEIKNVEVVEENIEEVKEESKLKKFASKIGTGFKKHGKKVAIGAAVGAVGLILYRLGKKSSEETLELEVEGDIIDVEYSEGGSEE